MTLEPKKKIKARGPTLVELYEMNAVRAQARPTGASSGWLGAA